MIVTADDLYRFISGQFADIKAEMAAHRLEMADAVRQMHARIDASNSRIDTLTHWMMTSMVGAGLALVGAVLAWFNPKHS